jgi:ATP-dependent DNA helicase RecQ
LLGQESIRLRKDPPKAPKPSRSKVGKGQDMPEGLDEEDGKLFAALRRKRLELAREEGVAAYVVFADRTLIELARERPLSLREMAGIYGIGTAKLERYGEAFLEVVLAG